MKRNIVMRMLATLIIVVVAGCQKPERDKPASNAPVYTCPMHTDVQQPGPGKCPVCGMELVLKGQAAAMAGLMLNDSQVRLANITTQRAARQEIGQTIVLTARLAVDEKRTQVVSSRTAGRVERLYIKETGRPLRRGDPFMEIYSESLLTIQKEFLLAVDQNRQLGSLRYEAFVKSARKKLLLFGMSNAQVDALEKTGEIRERVTFLAPAGGIISEILVTEGQYVEEGTALYRVDDVRQLWVEAELYPGEAAFAKEGEKIVVKIPGQQPDAFEGIVTFVSPEYTGKSQVVTLRAIIDNRTLSLKPGMQAQVFYTHSAHKALTIPIDAIIRDGRGTHVYVQSAQNTFQPRMVKTGVEDFEQVEIISGLEENEIIAVTGAYLLYSELILKKGTDPMAGHTH